MNWLKKTQPFTGSEVHGSKVDGKAETFKSNIKRSRLLLTLVDFFR